MELIYRSVGKADTDAVCALWGAAGLGGGLSVDRSEVATRLKNDDGLFLLAFDRDDVTTPLGVVMGCNDDHRGWLKRVAVDPAHQGQGVGGAMVAEVERRFVLAGITKMRLAVWEQNEAAGRFWEARGYEELPAIRYFVKDLAQQATTTT